MRASRRMALLSANENYEYYDYIHLTVRSSIARNSAFPRLITPVTDTDVIIRSTVMLDGRYTDSSSALLFSKSGGHYDWIGSCIKPSKFGGNLKLYTSSDVDDEIGVAGWIQTFAQEYQIEMRVSLNNLSSDNVTIELGDPSRAGVIRPSEQPENEDILMLIMPMLLSE